MCYVVRYGANICRIGLKHRTTPDGTFLFPLISYLERLAGGVKGQESEHECCLSIQHVA
ncbi:MAG: hypothetical protein LBL41_00940 [Bifidobacteriaceae bacterium]|nr:hypothetical protein [Bifidobacteriaceae bacterium]